MIVEITSHKLNFSLQIKQKLSYNKDYTTTDFALILWQKSMTLFQSLLYHVSDSHAI